jgi:metal-sulfur cluster biosynthetic enzyme
MVPEAGRYADIQTVDTDNKRVLIVENLKEVYDPEISVNVYDLGLIYNIDIVETTCNITMSLTSAFCPSADDIINDVRFATLAVKGINDVNVRVVFDPTWGPELMSDDAKLMLGID